MLSNWLVFGRLEYVIMWLVLFLKKAFDMTRPAASANLASITVPIHVLFSTVATVSAAFFSHVSVEIPSNNKKIFRRAVDDVAVYFLREPVLVFFLATGLRSEGGEYHKVAVVGVNGD